MLWKMLMTEINKLINCLIYSIALANTSVREVSSFFAQTLITGWHNQMFSFVQNVRDSVGEMWRNERSQKALQHATHTHKWA